MTPEQRALNNLAQQEQDDLRTLAGIPKNSEVYGSKMEHYKAMSEMRMKME
jgi:hypothetical protein